MSVDFRRVVVWLLRGLALIAILLPLVYSQGEELEEDDVFVKNNGFGDVKFEDDESGYMLVNSGLGSIRERKGFWAGFSSAFMVILVSEIGDKTFFIAAILAMRHSRIVILIGAFGALALMTALSAGMGHILTVIPRMYTFYGSTILFLVFGAKLIKEGMDMGDNEGLEELEEVDQEIQQKIDFTDSNALFNIKGARGRWLRDVTNGILLQAFTMTFLAEWGDRSQITTVVLATREDALSVTLGGSIGHLICTSCAVIGGRMMAQRISVKHVTLVGGVVFVGFGLVSLYNGMGDD